jgi:hypothetical protein
MARVDSKPALAAAILAFFAFIFAIVGIASLDKG